MPRSSIPNEFHEESGNIELTAAFGHKIEEKLARVPLKLVLFIEAETLELFYALTDELTGEANCLSSGDNF